MQSETSSGRVLKRTKRACEACKERKVKCSGEEPCNHCSRRRNTCIYREYGSRVLVSKEYLQELERRHAAISPAARSGRAHFELDKERELEDEYESVGDASPFGTAQSTNGQNVLPNAEEHPTSENISRLDSEAPAAARPRSSDADGVDESHDRRSHSIDVDQALTSNPLVAGQSFTRDAEGRFRFLGPSSTWSFTRRVIPLIEKHLPYYNTPPIPTNTDGTAYKLKWSRLPEGELPDFSDLPARDYAIYIFNTFTFHVGQLFLLIDEETFIQNLDAFYNDAQAKVRHSRLWYAQFLFVLAFGKAFLAPVSTTSAPAGSSYAIRALSLIPDFSDDHAEALLEIEVLCLAALYLQSLDMRLTAYQYIGQALRLCYIEGLHREWPVEEHGAKLSKRCSNAWWTVYVLDQEFSALMGAPSSIFEKDVTAPLPSERDTSVRGTCSTLQIRLSRLTSRILTTVYGAGQQSGSSFLSDTRDVLRNLAEIAREADDAITARIQSSVGGFTRMSTHMTISYHHCIVLATRPLVMWMLQKYLESVSSPGGPHERPLAAPIVSLLQTCLESATAILKLLRTLSTHDLLDTFLPFHLEGAFSSAFVLQILHVTCPRRYQDKSWESAIHNILDTMIRNGSAPAKLRQAELGHLSSLLSPLVEAWNSPASVLQSPSTLPSHGNRGGNTINMEANHIPDLHENWPWDSFDPFFATGIMGVAHDDMLQLADQLGVPDFAL